MKLYGSRSRVRFALCLGTGKAGATYDYVRVWMMKGKARRHGSNPVNPAGKIPVLEDGDLTLTESAAIVHYIAEISTVRSASCRSA